jgi:thiamine pyrophosphokinase
MKKEILSQLYPFDDYTAIIANGEFPKENNVLNIIKHANKIMCCDGAINQLEKTGISPDYIVGDGDSIDPVLKQKYHKKFIEVAEQETNDLTKAFYYAFHTLKQENFIFFAATGHREDHAIATISLLIEYAKITMNVAMVSDYGIFTVCLETIKIPTFIGQSVSIFAVNSETRVTSEGLRWPLNNFLLDSWYKASLNKSMSDVLTLKSTFPVLVYRAF